MPIDDKTIDKLAKLAKLEFSGEEKEVIRKDLDRILQFIDKIDSVNTDNVEPLIYMNDEEDNLRDDIVNHTISQQEALKNAPAKDSDYIRVPKVLKRS